MYILSFIIATIIVWAFGCLIINNYEIFYEFAESFSHPYDKIIKVIMNLPYVGFIIGMTTIGILLIVCCVGIIVMYPFSCIEKIFKD